MSLWSIPDECLNDSTNVPGYPEFSKILTTLNAFDDSVQYLGESLFRVYQMLHRDHYLSQIELEEFRSKMKEFLNMTFITVKHPTPIWTWFQSTSKVPGSQRRTNKSQDIIIKIIGLHKSKYLKCLTEIELDCNIVKIYDNGSEPDNLFNLKYYPDEKSKESKAAHGLKLFPDENGLIKITLYAEIESDKSKRPPGVAKRRYSLLFKWKTSFNVEHFLNPFICKYSYPFFILCKNDSSNHERESIIIERGCSNLVALTNHFDKTEPNQINREYVKQFYTQIDQEKDTILMDERRIREIIMLWFKKKEKKSTDVKDKSQKDGSQKNEGDESQNDKKRTLSNKELDHLLKLLKKPTIDYVLTDLRKCKKFKENPANQIHNMAEIEKTQQKEVEALKKIDENGCVCNKCRNQPGDETKIPIHAFFNHVVATRSPISFKFGKNEIGQKERDYLVPCTFFEMLVRQEEIFAMLSTYFNLKLVSYEDQRDYYYIYGFLDKDSANDTLKKFHAIDCPNRNNYDGCSSHQCRRLLIRFSDTRYGQLKITAYVDNQIKASMADFQDSKTNGKGNVSCEETFLRLVKTTAKIFNTMKVYPSFNIDSDILVNIKEDTRYGYEDVKHYRFED